LARGQAGPPSARPTAQTDAQRNGAGHRKQDLPADFDPTTSDPPPAPAAARQGIGAGGRSGILLSRVPESGKIHIVQNGLVRAKELVLAEWQKTLFLRNESPETRGWLLDVMKCVESLGKRDFTLDEVYAFERHLGDLYPGNQNVRPKIRQQLQFLRDRGFIDFVSRGSYRLRS
jgi:type II restriction enzyme